MQYRMNATIMNWSSHEMYADALDAPEHIRTQLLCDLPHVTRDDNTEHPFVFIDTAGCDMNEDVDVMDEGS